jgi:hypothetical protein
MGKRPARFFAWRRAVLFLNLSLERRGVVRVRKGLSDRYRHIEERTQRPPNLHSASVAANGRTGRRESAPSPFRAGIAPCLVPLGEVG